MLPTFSMVAAAISPETREIIINCLWFLLISLALFGIASFFIVAHILYKMHLCRKNKKAWGRECSSEHPLLRQMYDEGVDWAQEHELQKKELHIVNAGLNLYGEYYDFGFKRAVIVVPGRTEALRYSYYFAKPYVESGFNVLAIDQRSHGESDGKYNTLGFEEHKDVIAWGKLLHESYGVETIVLHGNCIGCSCCVQVLTNPHCPPYFAGMVAEGMYPNFYESFKNHMIEMKRPVHPCIDLVDMWMRVYTGHTMKKGPADFVGELHKPLLMLHSLEDGYSLPDEAQKLYDRCASESKQLIWFDKGEHSQIRVNNTDRYDASIKSFLLENFGEETA